jgi:type IV pilus assembly protein PilN
MIRINLLPVKQAKKREYGRQQLALFIFFIFVEFVLLFLVYNSKSDELSEIERAVTEAQAQVAQVQDYQNRITQLERELGTLEADQRIYDNLQANRIGPGGPLQELKAIMNRWTSERQRAEQEERGWNTDIDPSRVWVDSIDIDPTGFRLRGVARDGEDVAEFLLRLDTARPGEEPFFLRPVLSSYSRTSDPYFGEVMQFSISGGVRYRPVAVGSN